MSPDLRRLIQNIKKSVQSKNFFGRFKKIGGGILVANAWYRKTRMDCLHKD